MTKDSVTNKKFDELVARLKNLMSEHDKGNIGFRSIRIEDDLELGGLPSVNVSFNVIVKKTD